VDARDTPFREEHWRRIRSNNPLERILREIRRRTRIVGAFPDGQSALSLAVAKAASHCQHDLVDQEVSEHRDAEGPADESSYHRLGQSRAWLYGPSHQASRSAFKSAC